MFLNICVSGWTSFSHRCEFIYMQVFEPYSETNFLCINFSCITTSFFYLFNHYVIFIVEMLFSYNFLGWYINCRLVQTMDYSVIVFDTAPTGHTLRLLQFPSTLEKGLAKVMSLKSKFGGLISQVWCWPFSEYSSCDCIGCLIYYVVFSDYLETSMTDD